MFPAKQIGRREALVGIGAAFFGGALSFTAQANADPDLSVGAKRGRVVGVEGRMSIYEVVGDDGKFMGYALSAANMAAVRQSAREVEAQSRALASKDTHVQALDLGVLDAAKCAAAITWFAAQTVFPSVKMARVAAKLAGMVKKYGVKKVASVLTRWRKSKDRNIESDLKDLALALTGVGALSACVG